MNETSTPTVPQQSGRLRYIDLYRGVAILAVVGIHVMGALPSKLTVGSLKWQVIAGTGILLQFAVPAFLLLTAFLLTRSGLKSFDRAKYIRTRVVQTLPPYLIWNIFYTCLIPTKRNDFWFVLGRVLIGKGYFHLYFLFLIVQLYILIPLCLPIWRKRPPFWQAAIGTVSLTLVIYLTNRFVFHGVPLIGSVIFWYTPAISLGMWLGSQERRIQEVLDKGYPSAIALAVLGGTLFLTLSLRDMRHLSVNTFYYQVGAWVYATSMAFLLLWGSERLSENTDFQLLLYLGTNSMQIYLLHPLILLWLKGAYQGTTLFTLVVAFASYSLCAILLPIGFAWVVTRLRLAPLLFGRG